MEIKVTPKLIVVVLIGVLVTTLLVVALIHYEVKAAKEAAITETVLKKEAENQKQYIQQIEDIKKSTQSQLDASNKIIESLKTAQQAQDVLLRNIPNAKPYVIQVPSPQQPVPNAQSNLPDAPQPQVKKDNLLCYDEKGQIELAKFSEQCRQTSITLGGAQATIAEKDKIIASQGNEVTTLKNQKMPGFWKKTWGVVKVAVPVGLTAYLAGRAQKGK